ncbi:MAG: class I SAM-dependent DNA methyltransferase [Rhizobiaceae bacterium]
MSDTETIAVYDQQVTTYANLSAEENPDSSLKNFIENLPDGGTVLDLGCGPADASVYMRENGLNPDPVDASPEMVKIANKTHNIGARLFLFEDLDSEKSYDGIWANFSLLHARKADFPNHLQRIHRALKPMGLFHIGMKLGEGERRDRLGRFYAYYSQDELQAFLVEAGFEILSSRTGEGKGLAGDVSPFAVILARKI